MIQPGTILHRGSTRLRVVRVRKRDGRLECQVSYPDYADMPMREWYPLEALLKYWRTAVDVPEV